ncbi:hypothetical protein VR45_13600 [Streptomyces sp. NRRL S-495]|nr:hypothetical protein VR45_13600 [Streptomyces sp. NRRL S-495]
MPTTRIPRLRAICAAALPTPPETPRISRVCPAPTPMSRTASSAVAAATGRVAARSKPTFAGFSALDPASSSVCSA